MKTDTELQREVLDELAWEPNVDAAEIGVSVEDGVVILNGTVKTLPEKWSAERAAQRVEGVRAVTDELEVKLPGEGQGDAEIAREAGIALDWNTVVPRNRIKILVSQGRVTLEGEVDHPFQKDAAEGAVLNVPGVKGVNNMITAKALVCEAADIKYRIFKALERAAETEARDITVETLGSRVILRGNAKTWAEREAAERAARSASGVTEVQNEIQVAA